MSLEVLVDNDTLLAGLERKADELPEQLRKRFLLLLVTCKEVSVLIMLVIMLNGSIRMKVLHLMLNMFYVV